MMTNVQLYLAIGLPIFAILTSLIVSLVQISAIRSDMRDLRTDVKSDLAENKAEMKLLRTDVKNDLAENKAEMKSLQADIRSDLADIRQDIKLLTGKVYEMMGQRP